MHETKSKKANENVRASEEERLAELRKVREAQLEAECAIEEQSNQLPEQNLPLNTPSDLPTSHPSPQPSAPLAVNLNKVVLREVLSSVAHCWFLLLLTPIPTVGRSPACRGSNYSSRR